MNEAIGHLDLGLSQGALVARFSGELDLSNAPGFRDEIESRLAESDRLVADLAELTYFDSAGVRMLDGLVEVAEKAGVRVHIVAPSDSAARYVLRICAFREDVIAESLSAALDS